MKQQLTPYIFPAIALIIVAILVFRWYRLNTQNSGIIPDFGEQVQVQDLSPEERDTIMRGTGDYATVTLQPEGETDEPMIGEVRYDRSGERVRFTVSAELPELEAGLYQVWLRDTSRQSVKPVFTLEAAKGGYMGSASLLQSALPVEVVISRETELGEQPTEILMVGTIPLEEVTE